MKLNVLKGTAKHWSILLLLLASLTSFAQQEEATQEYVISGEVSDISNEEPIIGATVMIEGTSIGAITDIEGKFTFKANLETKKGYTLVFRFVGYEPYTSRIYTRDKKEITKNVKMMTDLLSLEEVVVTGASVGTQKRQLGNAISTVKSKDLENTASTGVDQALSGKIAGALVQQNTGDPAGGISIRLRGSSTIAGSSDPLYIIDGVLVSNGSNELVDIGGTTQNRIVDINPADIERIEVIKGAAAAAIYGSRASNGVVQIFTKRGEDGKPEINFSTAVRVNQLRKKIDVNTTGLAWENPFDRTDLRTVEVERYDYQDEFFETSIGTENNLSVRGGNQDTKYFVSGSYLNNGGIVKNSRFERFGARLNLDQIVNKWLSFSYGLSYTNSQSQDVPNGGINAAYGAITGFVFSDNAVNPQPSASGVYPTTSLLVPRSNPLEAINRFKFGQTTNRIISNLGITATPIENLVLSYRFGIDYYNQSATGFIPVGNTSTQQSGFATRGDANVFQYNNDLNASYELELSDELQLTSTVGGTWQQEKFERIGITSNRLAPTVEVATGGTIIGQVDARSEVSYWGGFLQETLGYNEKLFATVAARLDGASVFGPDERTQVYLKASGSYVISNEEFWEDRFEDAIPNMKLRVSWGQAGNLTAIGAFDRFLNYNPISYNGTSGVLPSTLLGNEGLAPERMEEIEAGFDASFMKDRIGLEFTYYKQKVNDLLLEREVASSTGFTTRFENIGSLENSGIELLLRASVIRKNDLRWDVMGTFSSNKNKVTKVVGDRITLPGSFATSYVIPGESLGVFYRQFYARDDNGEILTDADGYPFAGTTEEGLGAKVIGDPNPDWFGSLINEVSYKNLSFRMQFDAVQGFDVFNWNRRLMDNVIFGGGANAGKELRGEQVKGLGGAQAGIFEEFVEDGSFIKLRELSISYLWEPNLPEIRSVRFSLIGRNLLSMDNYTGWDPEINTPGQSNGVRGFDFAGVPIPRTIQFGVNIGF